MLINVVNLYQRGTNEKSSKSVEENRWKLISNLFN